MHTLNDMIDPDSLLTTLEHGVNLGAAYVDARVIMRSMSYVSFEGCNLSSSDHSIECGVGIRVFTQNGRGYFSTDSLSREAVKRGIETALKIARLNQRGQKKPESHFKYSSAKKKEYWTDSEPCADHMEVPQKIYDYLTSATVEPDPEARNVFLCLSLLTQQLFANSEGSLIDTEIPRTYVTYSSYRIKEGKMSSLITDSRGHTEPLKKVEHEIPQILETVNSRVNTVRTSKKVNLQKMRSDVVVDSSAAGIVLHEAIGHPLEADSLVEGKSPFISDEGRMIGPEDVTIIDDGTLKGLYGSYPVDADGAASQRTLLVEKGVLKTYLIDLESGLDLGLEPNGSGRVGGFSGVPLPRSSNIFMKEGDWTT